MMYENYKSPVNLNDFKQNIKTNVALKRMTYAVTHILEHSIAHVLVWRENGECHTH